MRAKQGILAVAALLAAFSVFFSAGYVTGNHRGIRTSAPVESVRQTQGDIGSTSPAVSETEPATDPPASTAESTTEPDRETQEVQPTENSRTLHPVQEIPQNVQETVDLFNDTVNRVKSEQPKVYMTRDTLQMSDVLFGKKDITSALSRLNRDDRSRKEILPVEFPVGGESWSSRLKAEAVQSAACTDGGDTLTLRIVLKPESGVPLRGQSNHGSCFSIPTNFDFLNFDIPGVKLGDLMLTYSDCSIECVIDRSSGDLIRADYHIQAHGSMQITLAAILKKDCSAVITGDTSYEIEWP